MLQSGNIDVQMKENLLRGKLVMKIDELYKKCEIFSRACFCHAVAIIDLFQVRSKSVLLCLLTIPGNLEIIALTALTMSHKFLKAPPTTLNKLLFKNFIEDNEKILKQKIIEMQETILYGINFQFPITNCYDVLDSWISKEQFFCSEKRKKVVLSVKILMTAIKQSPMLSLHPQLACQIHMITKKEMNVSKLAVQLYRLSIGLIQKKQE